MMQLEWAGNGKHAYNGMRPILVVDDTFVLTCNRVQIRAITLATSLSTTSIVLPCNFVQLRLVLVTSGCITCARKARKQTRRHVDINIHHMHLLLSSLD